MISGAFSGLIAAGITDNLNGARGLKAWRWLFFIEGSITVSQTDALRSSVLMNTVCLQVVISLIGFFVIPDLPRTTSWLSDHEKQLAAWRLEEDIGEDDWVDNGQQSLFLGAKRAFL